MKKFYKHCKEDLEELLELLSDPDSGHGVPVRVDISVECADIMIDIKKWKIYRVRTVIINGEKTHFTETLYQQLLARGVITLEK